jgi:ferritin-like metal-binding protein YciE
MSDMFEKAKTRLLDRIESPRALLEFKLGSALKMEHTVLEMLGKLHAEAHRAELKQQLAHHADETRGHITNIEQASALGVEADDKPCPTIEALEKEGKANLKLAADTMVDAVILSGAAETEHHEIAVYEALITHAEALAEHNVVGLLQANLQQEQHTLDEVERATAEIARELADQAA